MATTRRRVAILAPMQIEADPIVRGLYLEGGDGEWRGPIGSIEVVTLLTNIGMAAARAAAERAVGLDVDLVMVVGIAGGLDPAREIGTVIRPDVVADRGRGTDYRPVWPDHISPVGVLSSGDDFITDPAELDALWRSGVIAVDMETAAIADVCEQSGVAWSVHRSISDRPSDGFVDDAVWAMTQPDGHADRDALAEYLRADPARAARLAQLARDAEIATNAAADDAMTTLRNLGTA
jgi:adenosylhomocysteine nucleosidase